MTITRSLTVIFLLLAALAAGCSGKVKCSGTITYPDGSPLVRGQIFFRDVAGKHNTYRGTIKKDGTFNVGERKDSDGIPAGRYRCWLAGVNIVLESSTDSPEAGNSLSQDPPVNHIKLDFLVDDMFLREETSGWEFDVNRSTGKLKLTVEKWKKPANGDFQIY